eukprot:CAMPEP_0116152174 /NCGR_PEP_ID=MMETSP0329-20121206/20506_1 /TAXON_ID=697910 /ORGANISM="Pseudo-nitzschia arenysensis, Strain B593" /LENGTH=427 /DNA_ID=CAMNT_0003648869 /DNA_START=61 /DNA_END=1344 /DNA_ORIENTATION=-
MNRTAFSAPSTSWIQPFLLGASASLSIIWLSQKWQGSGRKFSKAKLEKKPSTNDGGEELLDHEELSNRMLRKAEAVIQWRTSRLVVVIERCTNDHNYSAILRTAEALGIQTVYMIDPPDVVFTEDGIEGSTGGTQKQITRTPEEIEQRRLHHLFAQNATLTVRDFATTEDCVKFCRKGGYELWVTDLSQEAEALDIHSPNALKIPEKVALVFGTEAVGASTYMLEQADKRVYLPLRGYADSLNLSVATALITQALFFIDPTLIGAMSEDERTSLRTSWFTKLAQQRILSSTQKKNRKKLMGQIKKCETIQKRIKDDPHYNIQPSEQKKLDEWPSYKCKLQELDDLINPEKVQKAVQEWIDNPPGALTDLRRADTHRVCYVGKNTRELHKEHWKDMVATSNKGTVEGVSAMAFREKMGIVAGTNSGAE